MGNPESPPADAPMLPGAPSANPGAAIYVTQPYMPPLEEFLPYLREIWGSKWLTNNGQFHQQLEAALAEYLGVKYISLFSNGTLALITALQALRISGEVITTPFSFVATTHALHWNGIHPVFADIEADSFNLDPRRIAEAITQKTSAILPVHVYGRPCNIEAIQEIADTHGLKVIYDAAHAFGVRQNGRTILDAGDFSILSFHATKVFNTFEGGAVVSPNAKTRARINDLKNFGFADEVTVVAPGINAKMNEVQAAFGLLQLTHMEKILAGRKRVAERYMAALTGVRGIRLPALPADVELNHSYFPILVEPGFPVGRDGLYEKLRERNIYARRYFYPLISSFSMYRNLVSSDSRNLPVATAISEQVLCLPIFPDLGPAAQEAVISLIREIAG
ncbi:MAG: DegT/DnrJ/EryC1/StrS aminotransferase [Betaproteobacteria bacterium]|nr:DegT/DnrJ/EryC1/StrS aminotransferase [Betaproteobacteria bacterium]